ncbi:MULTISPECIES: hypothetical protein [unclassified Burkholderia]|nr:MULTISPECIES: hypothetical protein [unclassified Burkholderia]UEP30407.1 hypothetical protein LMA01_28875 [Burkholderia sp. B21-007]UEP44277.1 hypothetical protein LMA02_30055 [Burkholderia sp. B21-005]
MLQTVDPDQIIAAAEACRSRAEALQRKALRRSRAIRTDYLFSASG